MGVVRCASLSVEKVSKRKETGNDIKKHDSVACGEIRLQNILRVSRNYCCGRVVLVVSGGNDHYGR